MTRPAGARRTAAGLAMPALDHLASINMLNVILERTLVGLPPKLRSYPMTGVFVNLCRLTDKALNEYKAARADLLNYVSSNRHPAYLLRAIEHLENSIDATYRAVLNGEALRNNKIGRGALRLTDKQRKCLKDVRDAIEHSDERLLKISKGPSRPWFQQGRPFSLFVTNTQIAIGTNVLTYRQLVAAITKCHSTIEKIRRVPTGQPATADTTSASGGTISDAFKQSLRASITHA
jgi:hypothetical protein